MNLKFIKQCHTGLPTITINSQSDDDALFRKSVDGAGVIALVPLLHIFYCKHPVVWVLSNHRMSIITTEREIANSQ